MSCCSAHRRSPDRSPRPSAGAAAAHARKGVAQTSTCADVCLEKHPLGNAAFLGKPVQDLVSLDVFSRPRLVRVLVRHLLPLLYGVPIHFFLVLQLHFPGLDCRLLIQCEIVGLGCGLFQRPCDSPFVVRLSHDGASVCVVLFGDACYPLLLRFKILRCCENLLEVSDAACFSIALAPNEGFFDAGQSNGVVVYLDGISSK